MTQPRAILVSVEKINDGKINLCLDDVIKEQDKKWSHAISYTKKELSLHDLEQLDFDEKELADFGYAILARLHAFHTQGDI